MEKTTKNSAAKIRANTEYNKRQDNIMLRPKKDDGAKIREAAAAAGKPVQRFILDIVYNAIGHTPKNEK